MYNKFNCLSQSYAIHIFGIFCFEMRSSFVAKKNFSYRSPEMQQGCRLARLSGKDMGDFSARNQYFVVSAWLNEGTFFEK